MASAHGATARLRRAVVAVALVVAPELSAQEPPHHDPARRGQPRLQHSSRIVLEVDDAREAILHIGSEVRAVGGRLVTSDGQQLTADVPRQNHRALVRRLEGVGRLRSERLSTRDVTATVARIESNRAAALATRRRLESLKRIAQNVPENLALEREIRRATDDVATADAQLRQLEGQATLTRLVVRLIAAEPEQLVPAELPFPWLQRLGLEELYDPSGAPQSRGLELRAIEDFSAQLRAGYLAEGDATGSAKLAFTGALSARVLGEANPVGLFGGIDLALGASKGLVYGVQPLLGAGVPLGRRLVIGLSSGPGIDGITSVIPFGVDVPLELFVSIDAAEWMAASAWVQDSWVLASERRQDGSPHAPFGDELSAGLTLCLGPRDSFGSYSQRRKALVFGFAYRETMETALYELRFGWGFLGADFSG